MHGSWERALRAYPHTIETVNGQVETMGVQRLHARTKAGFALNVHASLVALACMNLNSQARSDMIGSHYNVHRRA